MMMMKKMLPLSLCFMGLIGVAFAEGNCLAHQMQGGLYIPEIPCIWPTFCCGDCNSVYCCISDSQRISDIAQQVCNIVHTRPEGVVAIVGGVGLIIILVAVVLCCRACACCYFYRRRQEHLTYVHVQEPGTSQMLPADQTLYPNANYGQYPYPLAPVPPGVRYPGGQLQG